MGQISLLPHGLRKNVWPHITTTLSPPTVRNNTKWRHAGVDQKNNPDGGENNTRWRVVGDRTILIPLIIYYFLFRQLFNLSFLYHLLRIIL